MVMNKKAIGEIIDADKFDSGDILSRAKSTLKERDGRKKVLDITTAKEVFDTDDILNKAKHTLKEEKRKNPLTVNITALRKGKKKGTKAKRKNCGCK